MKNKGFTLIELIVTIAIMALIGVVISTNMLGLFSNEEDKKYEEFLSQIEEAACIYVETAWSDSTRTNCRSTNNCTVTINQLILKGYISDDLKDPSTGLMVTNNPDEYKVTVSWINNVKTCSIDN